MAERIKRSICQRLVDMAGAVSVEIGSDVRVITMGGQEKMGRVTRVSVLDGKVRIEERVRYEYVAGGSRVKRLP